MHRYQIVIYWNEGEGDFAAEVPELSGCIGYGSTHEAALEAAHKLVEDWLAEAEADGHPIPEPQGRLSDEPAKQGRAGRRLERIEKRRRKREQARREKDSGEET
jgi:predicted RNase H-like HicB family nuclease